MTTRAHLVSQVRSLLAAGRPADALHRLEVARLSGPLPMVLVRFRALALLQTGQPAVARTELEGALAAHPRELGLHVLLAEACRQSGDVRAAVDALEVAAHRAPQHWQTVAQLAESILERSRALAAWRAAAIHAPSDAQVLARLAVAAEQANDLEEAHQAAERALALKPNQPVALLVLARCARRRQDAVRAQVALGRIPEAQSGPSVWEERGRVAEMVGDSTAAQQAFAAMNATMRAQSPGFHFDRVDGGLVPALRALHTIWSGATPRWATAGPDTTGRAPVFLAGFNRSGTTLVGRMLGAHPSLALLDEEDPIDRISSAIGPRWPGLLDDVGAQELAALRATYHRRVDALHGADAGLARPLDKLPMHTMRLAMIHRLFPSSPVVFVHRDPRDVVLSNWMQCYAHNAITAHFDELAGCVALYTATLRAGFAQMRALPGLPVIWLRYEDVVADWQGEIRRVLD
ncbi:MAG TPA: hypothetical protein DFR83_18890, partial [Deltaproteobacteria bacterium]|nr:hypothetical protein [Deltaproteobacteria bacterium]